MDRSELKARMETLNGLAKQQMGRVERFGLSGALSGVAQHLGADERAELLFGGQIDGKQAVVALTDRRLLAPPTGWSDARTASTTARSIRSRPG